MKIDHTVHLNGKETHVHEFKKKKETAQKIALVGLSKTSMVIIVGYHMIKRWGHPSAFSVKSHGLGLRRFVHAANQR
jgi:hypothetical protein